MSNEQLLPLQTYYTQAFPERENAQVSNLTCLNNGWESDVYFFTVQWGPASQRQGEDLILRIYPGADAFEKSAAEFRALSLLKQLNYPVPRVDRLERDASPFGKPFIIMEAIHGAGMWRPMFHSSAEEQQKLFSQFCGLFARLHALDWRAAVTDRPGSEPGSGHEIIERQFNRWKPIFDALPVPGFQANMDWLMTHQHDITSQSAALVHWDFHPDNILIKENGEAVVIDWTGLDLTDYRFDLAWTLLLVSAAQGYAWREKILYEYERQAGHAVDGLEIFDAAACVRRLYSVMVSLTFGPDKLGMRPGAEEQMRRQAPSLGRVYEQLLGITHLTIPEVEQFLRQNIT